MEEMIKVPVTNEKPKANKRAAVKPKFKPREESVKRQKNVETLAVLGEKDASVRLLEDLVFGGEDELLDTLAEHQGQKGSTLLEDNPEDSSDSEVENESRLELPSVRKAAWSDDDDDLEEEVDMKHRFRKDLTTAEAESTMTKQKLQQRMKDKFQKAMGGTPSWAEVKVTKRKRKKRVEDSDEEDDEEDDDDDDLLRKTGNFVTASDSLPSGILRVKTCLHANTSNPSNVRLTTVQFHPSAQVVMTAGLDHSVSLFQVDGKTNPKIQSIHLERFPVHKAQFTVDGKAMVATSFTNKMFYIYDMMEGRVVPVYTVRGLEDARVKEFSVFPEGNSLLLLGSNGYLHILTLKTKEIVQSMKINGNTSGVAFNHDGSKIFAQSEEGEVFVWDVRSSRCVNKFTDDGCVKGTSIAASRNGQYLACGSQSGVVNIYSQKECLSFAKPTPMKAVMNLVTAATSMAFNPQSEILAIASREENDAVRFVHLPSLKVFSNFPLAKKRFCRTSCLDFSPHSGFFSLANNKGHAPLIRLLHYKDF